MKLLISANLVLLICGWLILMLSVKFGVYPSAACSALSLIMAFVILYAAFA